VFTALPLATLISASLPPVPAGHSAILSPEGRMRYFVVHGGLFSRDGVTLDEIRKIPRIGQQPGNDGLMCEVREPVWKIIFTLISSISYFGQIRKSYQDGGLANGCVFL